MSHYIENISHALVKALAAVPSAQPHQVAGYWANRDFWTSEFFHLLDLIDGYDSRLDLMLQAQEACFLKRGGSQYHDQFGNPKQNARDTTNPSSRRFAASEARTALKALADRALDLRIATNDEYDQFVSQLRISNRNRLA